MCKRCRPPIMGVIANNTLPQHGNIILITALAPNWAHHRQGKNTTNIKRTQPRKFAIKHQMCALCCVRTRKGDTPVCIYNDGHACSVAAPGMELIKLNSCRRIGAARRNTRTYRRHSRAFRHIINPVYIFGMCDDVLVRPCTLAITPIERALLIERALQSVYTTCTSSRYKRRPCMSSVPAKATDKGVHGSKRLPNG